MWVELKICEECHGFIDDQDILDADDALVAYLCIC